MNNTNCCVPQCTSRASKNPELSFHCFPREDNKISIINTQNNKEIVDRRKEWLRRLRIGKEISKWMLVCSRHFDEKDFIRGPGKEGKVRERVRLKMTAIPTMCLPILSTFKKEEIEQKCKAAQKRQKRLENRAKSEKTEAGITVNKDAANALSLLSQSTSGDAFTKIDELKVNNSNYIAVNEHMHNDHEFDDDAAIAENSEILSERDMDNLHPKLNYNNLTAKKLNILTGLPNTMLLDKLTTLLITCESQTPSSLTVKEQVVMTMMRIKLDLKFSVLAIFFCINRTTCKNIFVITVLNLKRILQSCLILPSKEETVKSLPKCFSNLKSVRIVVDCIESPVQKTKCLTCSINTYSLYKSRNTLKYMIFMSPDGIICHVSNGYGGRASDKIIFNQSGMIEQLEPYVDSVLVDKGFLIEDECNNSHIDLIRPPFAKNGKLSAPDAHRTRRIARARVHVERVIQRLKIFQLLSSRVPWTLVPYMDDIMIILCGITNLSAPILANDKF